MPVPTYKGLPDAFRAKAFDPEAKVVTQADAISLHESLVFVASKYLESAPGGCECEACKLCREIVQ